MTPAQRSIRDSWTRTVRRAIELGDADAAYRLTLGFLQRLRELGVY